jgi:hypothetical protein
MGEGGGSVTTEDDEKRRRAQCKSELADGPCVRPFGHTGHHTVVAITPGELEQEMLRRVVYAWRLLGKSGRLEVTKHEHRFPVVRLVKYTEPPIIDVNRSIGGMTFEFIASRRN